MKIVVAGRFDYIRFAWQKEIDNGQVMYFEDGVFRKLSFKNKLFNRVASFFGKFNKKIAEINKCKNALREYFDIDSLKRKDEILFILYEMNFISSNIELLNFLKSYFKKAKFVLYFTNVIGTTRPEVTKIIMDNIGFYNLVYTFNELDTQKYVFNYSEIPHGDYASIQEADIERFDVFYAGRAKDRLNKILSVAKRCKALGLSIKFFISYAKTEEQVEMEGVTYCDYMPYIKMLSYEKRSRAILSIMDGVTNSITLRDEEPISMGKILITDNENIENSKYYTESKVIKLNDLESQVYKIVNQKDSEKYNNAVVGSCVSRFLVKIAEDLKRKN